MASATSERKFESVEQGGTRHRKQHDRSLWKRVRSLADVQVNEAVGVNKGVANWNHPHTAMESQLHDMDMNNIDRVI